MHQAFGVQSCGGKERVAVESKPTMCENRLFPPAKSQLLEVPAGTSPSVADTITRVLFLNQTAQHWLWEKLSMTPTQWGHIGEQTVKTQRVLMARLEFCSKGAAVVFCTSMQYVLWLWHVCINWTILAVLLREMFNVKLFVKVLYFTSWSLSLEVPPQHIELLSKTWEEQKFDCMEQT